MNSFALKQTCRHCIHCNSTSVDLHNPFKLCSHQPNPPSHFHNVYASGQFTLQPQPIEDVKLLLCTNIEANSKPWHKI